MTIQPPATILMAPTGAGKTHALSTYITDCDLDLFLICTEPTGLDTIIDAVPKNKLHKLHYVQINPARSSFDSLLAQAQIVSRADYEYLTKQRPTPGRENSQYISLLKTLVDFKDQHGQSFGPVSKFGPTRALALDSFSGVSLMAWDLTIGDKATAHQGEWGVAMGTLEKLVLNLTSNLQCFFTLTAHITPERDEVTGSMKLMVSTLGTKLSPKIPRFFSEVIMPYREGSAYFWNTAAPNVDLKHRALPVSAKLAPSFKPIVDAYNARMTKMAAPAA